MMSYIELDETESLTENTLVQSLIAKLASTDGVTRMRARAALEDLGPKATSALVGALADPRVQVRWEITKTLAQVADPDAAGALLRSLRDDDFGVRWLAAEGLVKLRRDGLVPLLETLSRRLVSERFRAGAHHVIQAQVNGRDGEILRPVLEALSGFAAREATPGAARRALASLER